MSNRSVVHTNQQRNGFKCVCFNAIFITESRVNKDILGLTGYVMLISKQVIGTFDDAMCHCHTTVVL